MWRAKCWIGSTAASRRIRAWRAEFLGSPLGPRPVVTVGTRAPIVAACARPAIITGADRDEPRLGEAIGAKVMDGALAFAGLLGAGRLRDRYRSITNVELAAGLVRVAMDPAYENRVVEGEALRG